MKTKHISIIALAFVSLFTSCKTTEEITSSEEATSPKGEVVSEAPANGVIATEELADTNERTFFASIVRTPCYGNCPTYNMTIYSDGYVELEGIRGIELIGKYTTHILPSQIQNIKIRANRTGFMYMEDSYDGSVTDLPSATTTIILEGVRKSVYRRYNYPPSILKFEVMFDDLLKSERWTPIDVTEE